MWVRVVQEHAPPPQQRDAGGVREPVFHHERFDLVCQKPAAAPQVECSWKLHKAFQQSAEVHTPTRQGSSASLRPRRLCTFTKGSYNTQSKLLQLRDPAARLMFHTETVPAEKELITDLF